MPAPTKTAKNNAETRSIDRIIGALATSRKAHFPCGVALFVQSGYSGILVPVLHYDQTSNKGESS
jgi:hypothetical protein